MFLKLRVWNNNKRKMESYIDYEDISNLFKNLDKNEKNFYDKNNSFLVMKSTDFKDKNGQELYDGDVIDYKGIDPLFYGHCLIKQGKSGLWLIESQNKKTKELHLVLDKVEYVGHKFMNEFKVKFLR